jgi:integrase
MRVKLTSAFCRDLVCPDSKKKEVYRCVEQTGFGIEARYRKDRSRDNKTYYFYYTDLRGKAAQIKIGGYSDISFENAKRKVKELRSRVVLGGDPTAEKAERKAVPLYSELAKQHLADAELHQRSYSTTEMYMRRHILPKWGKTRVSEINSRDVAQWLADKRKAGLAPATVVKIKSIFGRSYELGVRWGIPGCDKNPVRGIETKPLNNARERYVTHEEAARLLAAAKQSKNDQLAAIIGLLLLTGMRVSELLSTKLKDVDLERRSIYVPTSKTGRSRYVPLAQAAITIIEEVPKAAGAVYLFPSPKDPKKHLTTIKHAWQTARDAANLPGLRIHDLRHSAASFMVNSGVDLFAVGKVLGHASFQSSQRYSHLANDTLLAAVEAGAAKMNL